MLSVTTPVNNRRVLLLGAAGLVPAALVTLLLVHQPAIGHRRVYPMLRGSLTVVGLGLALAAVIAWAIGPGRVSRSALTGLAWAGVTAILCIGPFIESTPRPRLYALELATGNVVWTASRPWTSPVLVDPDHLVVTNVNDRSLAWLDPATGAYLPAADVASPSAASAAEGVEIVPGGLQGVGADGRSWSVSFPGGDEVLAFADTGESVYAYVSTQGVGVRSGGSIYKVDSDDGHVWWHRSLPPTMAAETPALAASDDVVVVAGGERIGVLEADDGRLRWTQSVAELGKSRGYALPGAGQQVLVNDALVFLSTTPHS